jgi:hypothetical protein
MNQYSLHFDSVTDICRFIKTVRLSNFLLLGKKSILVASLPDTAMRIAKEIFHAELVDGAETKEVSRIYFSTPVCIPD